MEISQAIDHPHSYYVGLLARYSELQEGGTIEGMEFSDAEWERIRSISEQEVDEWRAALESQFAHILPHGI